MPLRQENSQFFGNTTGFRPDGHITGGISSTNGPKNRFPQWRSFLEIMRMDKLTCKIFQDNSGKSWLQW